MYEWSCSHKESDTDKRRVSTAWSARRPSRPPWAVMFRRNGSALGTQAVALAGYLKSEHHGTDINYDVTGLDAWIAKVNAFSAPELIPA